MCILYIYGTLLNHLITLDEIQIPHKLLLLYFHMYVHQVVQLISVHSEYDMLF